MEVSTNSETVYSKRLSGNASTPEVSEQCHRTTSVGSTTNDLNRVADIDNNNEKFVNHGK